MVVGWYLTRKFTIKGILLVNSFYKIITRPSQFYQTTDIVKYLVFALKLKCLNLTIDEACFQNKGLNIWYPGGHILYM